MKAVSGVQGAPRNLEVGELTAGQMVGVGMCKEVGGTGEVTGMQEGVGLPGPGLGAGEWTQLTPVGRTVRVATEC